MNLAPNGAKKQMSISDTTPKDYYVDTFDELKQKRPELYERMEKMAQTALDKAADYSPGEDSYENLRQCEQIGISAWRGVLVRCFDKWSRIISFANKGIYKVKDENFADTLLDLSIYCMLCHILYKETNP